ncbi:MAG: hypothetical protein AAFV59_14505 [Pseudomonadota bacterium]
MGRLWWRYLGVSAFDRFSTSATARLAINRKTVLSVSERSNGLGLHWIPINVLESTFPMNTYFTQYLTLFPRASALLVFLNILIAYFQRSELNWWFAAGLGAVCLWMALKVMIAGAFHSRIFVSLYRPGLNLLMIGTLLLAALCLIFPTLLQHVKPA